MASLGFVQAGVVDSYRPAPRKGKPNECRMNFVAVPETSERWGGGPSTLVGYTRGTTGPHQQKTHSTMLGQPTRGIRRAALAIVAIACCAVSTTADVNYNEQIAPIFAEHCVRCHGTKTRKGDLDLSSLAGLQAGSESGEVLSAAAPEESRLLEVLREGEMPPEDEGGPLSEQHIELIRQWIVQVASKHSESQTTLNQHDVLPILLGKCAECHGGQLQEGKLDVRSRTTLLRGGESGPAIQPGNPSASRFLQRIAKGEMPPKNKLAKYSVKPVSASELRLLQRWVADGAKWIDVELGGPNGKPDPLVSEEDRQHWAFQTPAKPPVPSLSEELAVQCRNSVDRFIGRKLQEQGLVFSPPADPTTLVRRLSFDLLGLPPTPELAQEFGTNAHPAAFDRLVDQMLASPAYGERWGQYWLDLAGYADSEGVQHADPIRPHAYRYRDYVIQSFNNDKPYGRFLLEQIAGDELADYEQAEVIDEEIYNNLVATGFLRMTSDGTFSGITGFLPNRLDVIDDQIRVLSSAVMGVTIRCARCHSHKFDPLPQRDYYRMVAIFKGAMDEFNWLRPLDNPSAGKSRYLTHVTSVERDAWQQLEDELNAQIGELQAKKKTHAKDEEELKKLDEQIKQLEARRRPEPKIRALWDSGDPSPTYLLQRGEFNRPSGVVGPGVPSMLTSGRNAFEPKPPWPNAKKTGNRLALAKWLADPSHPLTARVIVNRVWKHHFGRGLHEPLDDFGKAAGTPTHPALLDWLAVRFVEEEMSLKWLHRQIVTSATYRQSSTVTQRLLQADPDNLLLSRMPLRRLEAEVLRDTLIAVAGNLDRTQFGPATAVETRNDGLVTSKPQDGAYRRSIYVQKRRTQRLTILDNFDRPRMSPNCVDRTVSNVAPQALHLMNNRMVHDLSNQFAERIESEVGDDVKKQVDRLYELAIGRKASRDERNALLQSLSRLKKAWEESKSNEAEPSPLANLCHAVMNSASFLYID